MAEPVGNQLENGGPLQTRIQTFRRHLTCADTECPSPNHLLKTPKMLPCLHRFCAECLKKKLERQRNNFNQPAGAERRPDQYSCPLDHCKALTGIAVHDDPPHDDDLPRTDEFLEKMVELFKLEESLANGDRLCEICEPDDQQRAVRVCKNDRCLKPLRCADCAGRHSREYPGHQQFLHVEDLRRVPESNLYACGLHQKVWYCTEHDEELRRMYCSVHDMVLCHLCGNDLQCHCHNANFLTVEFLVSQRIYANHKLEVTEKFNNTEGLRDRFRQAKDGIETRMDDLRTEYDNTITQINERHQRLVAALERQKEELQEKTKEIYERKKNRLELHLTEVHNAHKVLHEATDFIDSFLKVARDIEFYYEKTRISACLETIGERFDDNRYCITPQESQEITLHTGYNDDSEERIIKRILGSVTSTPCVPYFKINDPHLLNRLKVGYQTTITVISRDVLETQVPGRPLPDLDAYLEVPNREITISCPVRKRNESGKYLITMQPYRQYPTLRLHILHKRPEPFTHERIWDCPNDGIEVSVQPGIFPLL